MIQESLFIIKNNTLFIDNYALINGGAMSIIDKKLSFFGEENSQIVNSKSRFIKIYNKLFIEQSYFI